MAAISIRNLSKSFGKQLVLNKVNLEIGHGELFFLLGPSGCGKSTLLRHLAGFVAPDSGEILVDGTDIVSLPPHRRQTALMFQSYALWPHLNVAENIAFGLEEQRLPRAEVRERVNKALQQIQMSDLADRSIAQLSGGQQQRVALARALIVRPRCLLLDEPLSNLDSRLRQEMRTEIRQICKEAGVTTLYVTHDQEEALGMADRLAVMNEGRVIQTGNPRQIYQRPATEMVARFLGDSSFLPGIVEDCDEQKCRVSTPAGILESSALPEALLLLPGQRVQLSLRPEAFFFEPAADVRNQFKAQLKGAVYQGATTLYTLHVGDGIPFQISESCTNRPRLIDGQDIWVGIRPEDVVILQTPVLKAC